MSWPEAWIGSRHVLNEAVEFICDFNEHHIKLIKKGLRRPKEGLVPDAGDEKADRQNAASKVAHCDARCVGRFLPGNSR